MIKLSLEKLPEKIYYCRHGESVGNERGMDDNSLKDIPNHRFPLTEKGIQQAKQAAEFIREYNILADVLEVYTSNFLRAKQTLDIIVGENPGKIPIYEDSRLDEWWKGIFYSLTPEEISANYPLEKKIAEREGWHHYRPPQGEAGKDVEIRIIEFLIAQRSNIFISGHGRVAGFMKRILCSEPLEPNCKYEYPKNCELWLFAKDDKRYNLHSLFIPREA